MVMHKVEGKRSSESGATRIHIILKLKALPELAVVAIVPPPHFPFHGRSVGRKVDACGAMNRMAEEEDLLHFVCNRLRCAVQCHTSFAYRTAIRRTWACK